MHRIALLTHPDQRIERYLIWELALRWRAEGLEVEVLSDPGQPADADLAVLHVDRTYVPDEYRAFARRFPRVVNGLVHDTSKRAVSRNLVGRGDDYGGPVIVKSDLNYGGHPEARLERRRRRREAGRVRRLLDRVCRVGRHGVWTGGTTSIDPAHYAVLESAVVVPGEVWDDASLVVERFLPEREGDLYVLRKLWCFGDRVTHVRALSPHAVVKGERVTLREPAVAPPELESWRQTFGFEFGKVDYVSPGGLPVVLDVNPTPGFGRGLEQSARDLATFLAPGVHALLD